MNHQSPMTEAHKRALIIAYFLSRFDRKGARTLGYSTFDEAFNDIGAKLNVKPNTVKNMRDSFDPYCSQVRSGWHQRTILPSRANVITAYGDISEVAMGRIVRTLRDTALGDPLVSQLIGAVDNEDMIVVSTTTTLSSALSSDTSYATRQRTGEQAETFFISHFSELREFDNGILEDTRKLGTGFDFRVIYPSFFVVVEVKGVRMVHGNILFTDKEWNVADLLQEKYYLALVRSLDTLPTIEIMANPVAHLSIKMSNLQSMSVFWGASV